MPKSKKTYKQLSRNNKKEIADTKTLSNNPITNEMFRVLNAVRPKNVVLKQRQSQLSSVFQNTTAPDLAKTRKQRTNGSMNKPGYNYKHVASITTTYAFPNQRFDPEETVVNLRAAPLTENIVLIEDNGNLHIPLRSTRFFPVHPNGSRAKENTRLYAGRGRHVGPMSYGTTAHNVPNHPHSVYRRESLVEAVSKFIKFPVFAISTFSKPGYPLTARWPDVTRSYQPRQGHYVKTNLFIRNTNFSRTNG